MESGGVKNVKYIWLLTSRYKAQIHDEDVKHLYIRQDAKMEKDYNI